MSTPVYGTDGSDVAWDSVTSHVPEERSGKWEARTIDLRAISNLLRSECPWHLLSRDFPRVGTVSHSLRAWKDAGVLGEFKWALREQARLGCGCLIFSSMIILKQPIGRDHRARSNPAMRWPQTGKKAKMQHLLVDDLGLMVARKVKAASVSDERSGAWLLGSQCHAFSRIRAVMADAGHESRKRRRGRNSRPPNSGSAPSRWRGFEVGPGAHVRVVGPKFSTD
jgi:putative transposase